MPDFQPNDNGILVPVAEPEPETPTIPAYQGPTPEQRKFYDSLSPDFRKVFRDTMMARGSTMFSRHSEFYTKLYDVWVEYTGMELEEWT